MSPSLATSYEKMAMLAYEQGYCLEAVDYMKKCIVIREGECLRQLCPLLLLCKAGGTRKR
jgi:hypothetical protein